MKHLSSDLRAISAALRMTMCIALCAILLHSCSDDDNPDRLPTLQNIVEYAGVDEGLTSFHYYAPGSDTPQILFCSGQHPAVNELEPGAPILLAYTLDPAGSGRIDIISFQTINDLTLLQTEPEGLQGWNSEGVYLQSAWMAGKRLNLRLNLTYDTEPRRFAIIIDKNTINDPWPEAYLYHQRGSDIPNFSRQYYASCSLAPLYTYPDAQGLRLHILNTNTTSGTPQEQVLTFPLR